MRLAACVHTAGIQRCGRCEGGACEAGGHAARSRRAAGHPQQGTGCRPLLGGEHPASINALAAALAAATVCCLQDMACLVARWLTHHLLHSRIPGHDHTWAAATGGKGDASSVARSPQRAEAIAAASTRLRVVKLSLAAACLSGLACINWTLALVLSLLLLLVAWVGWATNVEGFTQEELSLGLVGQVEITGAAEGTGRIRGSEAASGTGEASLQGGQPARRIEGLVAGVREQQVEGAAGAHVAGAQMRILALGLPRRVALLLLSPAVLAGLTWVLVAELGQEPNPVQVVGNVCKGSEGNALNVWDMALDLAALRADALLGVMLWGLAVPFWALTWDMSGTRPDTFTQRVNM